MPAQPPKILIAPRWHRAGDHTRCLGDLTPEPSNTESIAIEGLGAIKRVEALSNKRICRLVEKIGQEKVRSAIAYKSTHVRERG
jgi:hypothetical protein